MFWIDWKLIGSRVCVLASPHHLAKCLKRTTTRKHFKCIGRIEVCCFCLGRSWLVVYKERMVPCRCLAKISKMPPSARYVQGTRWLPLIFFCIWSWCYTTSCLLFYTFTRFDDCIYIKSPVFFNLSWKPVEYQ